MRHSLSLAIAGAAVAAVLLAGAATAGAPRFADRGPQIDWSLSLDRTRELPPIPTMPAPPPASDDTSVDELPRPVEIALTVLFAAGLAAAAWWLAKAAARKWRERTRLTWRPLPPDDFEVLDPAEVAAAVAADEAAQRAALQRGSPRNAIVECWLRMEAVIVAAGLPRRPSDTSTDLVERTLATNSVDPGAIARLAELYREARFSSHAMSEAQRRDAIASLDAVHDSLRAGAAQP